MRKINAHEQSALRHRQGGVTLFELLITVSILAIIGSVSMVSWVGYQKTQALDAAGRDVLSALREAQGSAIARRDGTGDSTPDEWGVRIFNINGSNSIVEIFAGSTYGSGTVKRTMNLGPRVEFTSPTEGNSFDFIYEFRSGKLNTTSSTTLGATCPNVVTGSACLDVVMYNLSLPSDVITIRVWEQGGIELL